MLDNTVCFSGHRPEKLPFKGDPSNPQVRILMSKLFLEIDQSIKKGYTTFISGMAKGVDIWVARYVIEKKESNPSLKLICAIPYKGFGESWRGVDRWDFEWIKDKADEIIYICESYFPYCMKKRNEYMVDHSSKLIAVVGDYSSGTGQTIRYAMKKGLETRIINIGKEIIT